MRDLCRRSYMGVCRGGVCVRYLCPVRVSYNTSSKSVCQEFQVRVSYKSVK